MTCVGQDRMRRCARTEYVHASKGSGKPLSPLIGSPACQTFASRHHARYLGIAPIKQRVPGRAFIDKHSRFILLPSSSRHSSLSNRQWLEDSFEVPDVVPINRFRKQRDFFFDNIEGNSD